MRPGHSPPGACEVLGCTVTTSETKEAWNAFFADLVARGLGGVKLVTCDAHAGLVQAIAANLPGATWQRCRTHYAANLMSVTPKSSWPAVKAMLHSVYDQPDVTSAQTQFDKLLDHVAGPLPAVAEHLDAARADLLAFTTFPKEIWRQIWSNNPNERLNKEIRRRTDVVGIFPDRDSVKRLVGAVLAEQHDEWAEGRRYLALDVLHRARLDLITTPTLKRPTSPSPSPPEQNLITPKRYTTSRDLTDRPLVRVVSRPPPLRVVGVTRSLRDGGPKPLACEVDLRLTSG